MDVKSKILSLELVLTILQNAGPTFKNTYRFINTAFKRYLCPSIGINGTSSLPRVFQLTLSVFLLLISNFKVYLKVGQPLSVFKPDLIPFWHPTPGRDCHLLHQNLSPNSGE